LAGAVFLLFQSLKIPFWFFFYYITAKGIVKLQSNCKEKSPLPASAKSFHPEQTRHYGTLFSRLLTGM
jgi:hypothetical protein